MSLNSKECRKMIVFLISLVRIKTKRRFRFLVSPEISFHHCFSTFANVMNLPKREENKESCVGTHVLCQAKTTQWINGRTEARENHRINIGKDISLAMRNAAHNISVLHLPFLI
jgi:hypothetical protein